MSDDTVPAAIDAALKCDWERATNINLKLLKKTPNDIDCLNRLGKSFLEQGNAKKATFYFHKVLRVDKYNPIATKNLARIAGSSTTKFKKTSNQTIISPTVNFLEEPGKTRLVSLINVAPASTLLKQDHADCLILLPKRHTVVVEDSAGNYLGALPDDLGHRLSILMKGGNRYEAIAKSVSRNSIVVFLRETCRGRKFLNTPSFLVNNSADYLSFVREDSLEGETKAPLSSDLEDGDSDSPDEGPSAKLHSDEEE